MKYFCLIVTILSFSSTLEARHLEPLQFSKKHDQVLLEKHLQNNCIPINSEVALVRQCFDTSVVSHNKTHFLRVPNLDKNDDYLVDKKLAIAVRGEILYHFMEILQESKITEFLKELYERKP